MITFEMMTISMTKSGIEEVFIGEHFLYLSIFDTDESRLATLTLKKRYSNGLYNRKTC